MKRFLVTGAMGCIGAWVLKHLADDGQSVVVYDVATKPVRVRLLMDDDTLARVTFIQGDVTSLEDVRRVVDERQISHIIHLAALQVPFCRADPALGARVNVVGTVSVLEAARHSEGRVQGLVYASSIAVFGAPDEYPDGPVADAAPLQPTTLYGVYKQANEATARVYWQDWGVPSIGLRPAVVYGVARDQGLTSSPTKAMLAAALGHPYTIAFGGANCMQWASDVARTFIQAAEAGWQGADVCNLGGATVPMGDVVVAIEAVAPAARGAIGYDERQLPFPFDFDDARLQAIIGPLPHTPLADGVAATVDRFRYLTARGLVDAGGLTG